MKRLAVLAALAAAAAMPALSADQRALSTTQTAPTVRANPAIIGSMILFDCVVRGAPVEFPNDIVILNKGPGTVPSGYKIKWEAPSVNPYRSGLYTFGAPLAPQGHVFLSNVLPGGMAAEMPCKVTAMK